MIQCAERRAIQRRNCVRSMIRYAFLDNVQTARRAMTTPTDSTDTILAPGIVTNPARRRGKPTLAGTRITVEEVLSKLAADWSIEEILDAWPHLTRQQILQAI